MKIEPWHDVVLMASDGLWGVMESDTVARLIHRWRGQGQSALEVAQGLCQAAKEQGSADNITVLCMMIEKR
ncbi:unnamed protein product [Chrysoparadoxa australica]